MGQIRFAVKAAAPSKRLEKHSFDHLVLYLTNSAPPLRHVFPARVRTFALLADSDYKK
jgi:hypothetical protein